jgi:hypothetical protein
MLSKCLARPLPLRHALRLHQSHRAANRNLPRVRTADPSPAGAGVALQPVDEVEDGVKAASGAAADADPGNRYGQMRLAGSADQHGVALLGEKGATRQIADKRLVDARAREVEVVDILGPVAAWQWSADTSVLRGLWSRALPI